MSQKMTERGIMPAKTQSDLSAAQQHVAEAHRLVARGGDHVQIAVQHLAIAFDDLLKQLNG
jgi:hypothetical protein